VLGLHPAYAQESTALPKKYVPVSKFDPSRDASKDIQDAVVQAKQTGKRVLIDVGGDWCIWCRLLDTLFIKNRQLDDFRQKNFVVVKVNWSKENKNTAVLAKYPKVAGYPHLFVLDSGGKLLHSQNTGALESGRAHDPDKVMAFLKAWAPH
jgi:thiol:disulfide interchange protein